MASLKEEYTKKVIPGMMKDLGYKNSMAVPGIEKVVINIGIGKELAGKGSGEQKRFIKEIGDDLAMICGQRPALTKAKKSISGFKLRKGMPQGLHLTLRKKRMFDFLERLININLPRSRDFKGLSEKSIDKNGNITIGIREQIAFPEASTEKLKNIFGFEITIKTSAGNKKEGIELLRRLGFPLSNKE